MNIHVRITLLSLKGTTISTQIFSKLKENYELASN